MTKCIASLDLVCIHCAGVWLARENCLFRDIQEAPVFFSLLYHCLLFYNHYTHNHNSSTIYGVEFLTC